MRLLSILFVMFTTFSAKAAEYTINIEELMQKDKTAADIVAYYTDIYQSIDISPTFTFYPSRRGLMLANDGTLDAEAFRLDVVGEQFENLIKVNESIGDVQLSFICLKTSKCAVDESFVIGVLSTFLGAKDYCAKYQLNCHFIESILSIAKKLDAGMIDAVFATDIETEKILCLSNSDYFHYLPNRSVKLPMFHFINIKHANLKQGLENAILSAKNNGNIMFKPSIDTLRKLQCQKSIEVISSP